MALLVVFLLSVVVGGVTAFPGGAPSAACDTLMPQHDGNPSQTSPVPYAIDMTQFSDGNGGFWYTPGQTYTLRLSDPDNEETFRGFFVQSRLAADGTTRVGTFIVLNSVDSRLSSCARPEDGITHNNPGLTDFPAMMMNWTAPVEGTGPIYFAYAVVQNFSTFWANQRGSTIEERAPGSGSGPCPTCHVYAYCDYTGGTCRCNNGYTGDGEYCEDINECDYDGRCSSYGEYGECINTAGSYYCRCQDGYEYTNEDGEYSCRRQVYRFPGREIRDRDGCYPAGSAQARYEIGMEIRSILREEFGSGSGSA